MLVHLVPVLLMCMHPLLCLRSCLNYTRPVPLPCAAAADKYRPRWFNTKGRRRFVIYAWWPPNPADVHAYAEAGFNLALTENMLGAYCDRQGINATVTHDELFEANVDASDTFAKLGILTVFNTGNMCNHQLARSPTRAYGNATGGGRHGVLFEGHVNLTAKAHPGITFQGGESIFSKGQSVPELGFITSELKRRGKLQQFAGIQMHDDTVVQNHREIIGAAWLQRHEPTFVPFVNQVSSTSAPQSLYRSGYFVSAPEQYSIRCPGNGTGVNGTVPPGNCTGANATHMARQQMAAFAGDALVDQRFGLDSWPLFHVGDAQPNDMPGSANVRSDSLLRWMSYSAIAYGATGLNYYCWAGGLWMPSTNGTVPGTPTPMYAVAMEINADAAEWGDELLGGGYGFSGALHTGFVNALDGSSPPTSETLVTDMSEDLLVGVFVPSELRGGSTAAKVASRYGADASVHAPDAYLVVVDKRVSGQLERVVPRNVTLNLHPSVATASVAKPGRQGMRGFDELYKAHGRKRPSAGARRHAFSSVSHSADRREGGKDQVASSVRVTAELFGGGGAMVRLYAGPTPAQEAELVDAAYAMVTWTYEPGKVSLAQVKAPQWAYDSWHASYRPYENLEVTAGRSFEDGEQTNFIIGGSFAGANPPTAADEAKAWAWAGFNLLSMSAPSRADLAAYGPASSAIGATLDYGYAFGFFSVVEPASSVDVLAPSDILAINQAFRCHGRWLGINLGTNVSGTGRQLDRVAAAAAALRRSGRWLVPLASAHSASTALELGARGVAFAMPSVPPFTGAQGDDTQDDTAMDGGATTTRLAEAWAQAVARNYDPMRKMLSRSYVASGTTPGTWELDAPMPFGASLDACASDSDSMLRFAAFAALAYGARGIVWRGAGACAPVGSHKFQLLASINRRIAQWGNTFVASARGSDFPGGGYNVSKLYATGYALPGAVAPGSDGPADLVQSADDDVLVAELGSLGRPATPLLYVLDKRVSSTPGAAAVRTVRVVLHKRVSATQPVEGDCTAAHCQCGLSVVGHVLEVRLPGGSGQLVALVT